MENHQPQKNTCENHDVSIGLTINKVMTALSKNYPTFTSISMVIELSLAFITFPQMNDIFVYYSEIDRYSRHKDNYN